MWRATWPLAKLEVWHQRLVIRLGPLRTYEFAPENVVALDATLGGDMRLVHNKREYPANVAFSAPWSGGPKKLIQQIENAGFLPSAAAETAIAHPPTFSRPRLTLAIISVVGVLVWFAKCYGA